jgi:hypothetical protein
MPEYNRLAIQTLISSADDIFPLAQTPEQMEEQIKTVTLALDAGDQNITMAYSVVLAVGKMIAEKHNDWTFHATRTLELVAAGGVAKVISAEIGKETWEIIIRRHRERQKVQLIIPPRYANKRGKLQ